MNKNLKMLFVSLLVIAICNAISVRAETKAVINSHIKAIYEYNQDGSGTGADYTGCLGGAEAGCTDILSSKDGSSAYAVGTIIKYEVKDGEERYFNVIKDNGTTLTLQERENMTVNLKWASTGVSGGPTLEPGYVLYELEQATAGWTYVNTQNYSIGNSESTLGNSGCSAYNTCNDETYTLVRSAKARMITLQEAVSLGCTEEVKSCLSFVNNYCAYVTSQGGGTFNGDGYGYWTMSTSPGTENVWELRLNGTLGQHLYSEVNTAVRAVVVIDKADTEVASSSENQANPETSGETVNAEDTLKMSYLGYILGVIVIMAGAYVIYLGIEKKYGNEEE